MTGTHPRLSLVGMLDFIPKSRRPLAPVFEAISNALEAIAERHKTATAAQPGLIILRFYFTGLLDKERELERIEVSDNGIGFDADNFERFGTFLDRSKGYNNRGSGRVQFLHFVEQLDVTSHYAADGKIFKRHFLCNPKTYITELTNEPAGPATSIDTTIAMGGFLHKDAIKAYFDGLSVAELRSALKSQYLLRLHLARVANPDTAPIFRLEFYKNRKLFDSGTLSSKDVPETCLSP